MEKDSRDQEECTFENYGQQVMSIRTPEGLLTQEHVAGCRREKTSSVSIPHHPSRKITDSSGRVSRTS